MKVAKQRQGHFAKYGRGVAPLLAQPYLFQHKNHCDLTLAFNDLKNEKTRPIKQCEFCNHLLDKYLISQGYQSSSIGPSGPAGQVVPGDPSSGQGGQGDPVGQGGLQGPGSPSCTSHIAWWLCGEMINVV